MKAMNIEITPGDSLDIIKRKIRIELLQFVFGIALTIPKRCLPCLHPVIYPVIMKEKQL